MKPLVRTRFAPSPTGRLHLGHILAAGVAHQLARDADGEFSLRHEDIDGPRVREEYYVGIEEDLHWLGLSWDGAPLRQTSRVSHYETALESLKARGLVYPCFCTRREIQDELARMAAAPQSTHGQVYPRFCQKLSLDERDAKLRSGAAHAWRLDAEKASRISGPLTFQDTRFGTMTVDAGLLGDVVLARKDIGTAYHLAVVVDDAFQKITHVTRGEDLLASTHVHRLLQVLLKYDEPLYFHHRLVLDSAGKRLAKRDDALSIKQLRENGLSPDKVKAMALA